MAKIAKVEVLPIRMPADKTWFESGFDETIVVRITDENGIQGIGDAYASSHAVGGFLTMPTLNMWSHNIPDLLIGKDPLETTHLWDLMYDTTIFPGRRGLAIHAISAVDIALHDLAARQIGVPLYKLLGGQRRPHITPYATIFPGLVGKRSMREMMRLVEGQFDQAIALGFRVLKFEVLFYEHVTDRELVDLIKEGRRMVGDDIVMPVDFGYRWKNWHDAKWVIDRIADCNVLFAEAPLQHDDLAGHAKLAAQSPIRIGGAEFAATRWEVFEWLDRGRVSVIQAGISRAGGFTELMRIADLCEYYGAEVATLAWHTGITAAAARHFQAAVANAPVIEYFPPELFGSPLRRDLVSPEPKVVDGNIALPTEPGLGIALNEEIVAKYAVKLG
ncbi:MAG: mandelate racemase/muconate lactonizing enzyme family protein [Alphaproteobacteria bacterium]|nr:mandelate racemase/muconate lactonizing enzyme family protein [Alphaproteobacteria bacterium]